MKSRLFSAVALLSLFLSLSSSALVAQNRNTFFSNAGIRIGVDAENEVNLFSYELFATYDTDWSWDLTDDLRLDLNIETAIGGLSGEGTTAVYGRIAPVAELFFGDFPISLVLSSGPSLYSDSTFDHYDIGGNFHFTTGIGFNWNIDRNWSIGYRFQHTSNADLNKPNPGLDMHTMSLAYGF